MFENLRQAFREAVDNFKTELNRDRLPEETDQLLRRMEEELVEARTRNRRLEEEIRRALEQAEREEEERVTCRRRHEMASRIADEETARLAEEFAVRHRKRRDVLRRKALALRDELRMREGELEEMTRRLREARLRRDELVARAGRTNARETLQGADGLFEELDRMAERISDLEARAGATEEMSALGDDLPAGDARAGPDPSRPDPASDVEELEARLQELKRRMGRS